jgi:hypothetical protein
MPQLENQMEGVISGKETLDGYSDIFIRGSFAKAYTAFTERAFRRQIDKDRRADDLIVIFCSQATKVLQRGNARDSSWELLVARHVAMFVGPQSNTEHFSLENWRLQMVDSSQLLGGAPVLFFEL